MPPLAALALVSAQGFSEVMVSGVSSRAHWAALGRAVVSAMPVGRVTHLARASG